MKRKLNPPQNNPEGKFKLRCRMGAARSCQEARWHRAKYLAKTSQNRQAALACHLALPDRATWLASRASSIFVSRLAIRVSIRWDFRATLFRGFKLASLALLSAKCCSSFHFFNTILENIERRYMSKKCAKGGRFHTSLTLSNV